MDDEFPLPMTAFLTEGRRESMPVPPPLQKHSSVRAPTKRQLKKFSVAHSKGKSFMQIENEFLRKEREALCDLRYVIRLDA